MKIQENTIYCDSCLNVAPFIRDVDVVLTSPFYNTSTKTLVQNKNQLGKCNQRGRYDTIVDTYTREEYCDFLVELFDKMHDGIKDTGVVLFNISYSTNNPDGYLFAVSDIMRRTEYTLVDFIAWKKSVCIPEVSTQNRLTRSIEPIFVFCKRGCERTFHCNKVEIDKGTSNHRCFQPMYNFVEALAGRKEGDKCPFNAATYSVDLCRKLLKMYAPENALVYDPFMGSGTTAVACKELGMRWIGSEISQNQVDWANSRLENGGIGKLKS